MKKYKKIILMITMITFMLMVGCNKENNELSSKENINNKEEIVVATSVAVTEILDVLGVKVSGIPTTSYNLPDNTKDAVKVGNPMNPDLEVIKSLKPTCVVSVDTLGLDFEKKFKENNIPSMFMDLSTVDGLKETVVILGKKFNKNDKAKELINNLESKEAQLWLKNVNEKENILILFGAPGSVMVSSDLSYVGNLVEIAGGNNIFKGESSKFMQVNMEEIVKRNPDKILIMTHAIPEEAKKTVKEEFEKESWKQINAIKNNKIFYLENEYFGMSANLKVIEALEKLGEILDE